MSPGRTSDVAIVIPVTGKLEVMDASEPSARNKSKVSTRSAKIREWGFSGRREEVLSTTLNTTIHEQNHIGWEVIKR